MYPDVHVVWIMLLFWCQWFSLSLIFFRVEFNSLKFVLSQARTFTFSIALHQTRFLQFFFSIFLSIHDICTYYVPSDHISNTHTCIPCVRFKLSFVPNHFLNIFGHMIITVVSHFSIIFFKLLWSCLWIWYLFSCFSSEFQSKVHLHCAWVQSR